MKRTRLVAAVLAAVCLAGCGAAESTASPAPSPAGPLLNEWKPRLAIVFPRTNDGKPGSPGYAVNVSIWPSNRVLCDRPASPAVKLYVAKNFGPGDFVEQQPALTKRQSGSASFPSLEFDNVPANLVADPGASYSLVAYVRGQPASNAWLYGKPPNQYAPVKPTGYGSPDPAAVDTLIQVVFPHDGNGKQVAPAAAREINVAVDIFQHGTELSVTPDAHYAPQLWMSQGSAPLAALPPGVQKTTYSVNGQGFPRWVFNDVRVDPAQSYHLLSTVSPLGHQGGSFPNIWTHTPAKAAAPNVAPPPPCVLS